jgi:hypothetical protein
MMNWVLDNKEWIFSGVGIALVGVFISWLMNVKQKNNGGSSTAIQHLGVEGNSGQVNQIQNYGTVSIQQRPNNVQEGRPSSDYLHITLDYLPETGRGTSFTVEVVNPNSEPITIKNVSLVFCNGIEVAYSELSHRNINLPVLLPLKLGESDSKEFLWPLYDLNQVHPKDIYNPAEVKYVKVIDTYNREHIFPADELTQRQFQALLSKIQQHWDQNAWLYAPQ